MAGRLSVYRLFKKIHLYASIILFVFFLMYVFTGFLITNHDLFPHGEAIKTSKTLPFSKPDDVPIDQVHHYIKNIYQIKGRAGEPQQRKNGKWNFWISRPGLSHHIFLTENLDTISIYKAEQMTIGRVSSRLHHLKGYHGGWKYFIWASLYDLSAIAFIIFSLTGVYMWWRLRKKYKLGFFFLGIGILVPIVITILLIW